MYVLCFVLASALCSSADYSTMQGFVFGSGQFGEPGRRVNFVADIFQNMRDQGATLVHLMPTVYFSAEGDIYSITDGILRTDTPAEMAMAAKAAREASLAVSFSVRLEPDWRNDTYCPEQENCGAFQQYLSRVSYGKNFTQLQWTTFFNSYANILCDYIVDMRLNIDLFSLASELDTAIATAPQSHWAQLNDSIRFSLGRSAVLITVSAMDARSFQTEMYPFWKNTVDYIGLDARWPLHIENQMTYWPTNFTVPSVSQFEEAWAALLPPLEQFANAISLPILFTTAGYQAKFGSWRRPRGVMNMDPTDGSCWERSINMDAQAHQYEALLRTLASNRMKNSKVASNSWWAGVFFWLWRNEDLATAGGTCDDSFTPVNKPAMDVVSKYWRRYSAETSDTIQSVTQRKLKRKISWSVHNVTWNNTKGSQNATKVNSAVFGGGMWSSPYYRLNSAGANKSLEDLHATGANFLRLIVNWFFDNQSSVAVYPASNQSHLRSDTPDEILSILAHARSLGMGCHMAPYIDPNFDILSNCRGPSCGRIPGTPPKTGRGNACQTCSAAEWTAFFKSYGDYIIKHAKIAEQAKCEYLSVGSELSGPFQQEAHFRALIAEVSITDIVEIIFMVGQVRKVYSGKVTIAINSGQAKPGAIAFLDALDLVGVEGYYKLPVSRYPSLEELQNGWTPIVKALEAYHESHGKPIMFTEVGYQTRTGTYNSPASTNASDPFDGSVGSMFSFNATAQAISYEALLSSLYPKPWFIGVNWWLWRADPTAGGVCDYTFTPQGKPETLSVMKKWYTWYQ
eukprot:m.92517 g.92517  ORF g.92517 m.92517 type:complete len:796 (+) comp13355_c0_seq3:75-2462(+)